MAEGGDCQTQGRGRALPYGKPTERQALRRPYSSSDKTPACSVASNENASSASSTTENQTSLANCASSDSKLNEINAIPNHLKVPEKMTSNLSPNAKEFVPRNHCITTCNPTVQNQPESHKEENSDPILQQVEVLMFQMTVNPARFDAVARKLAEMINCQCHTQNISTLESVVGVIFDKSVAEPNLRYNGARLCNFLTHNLSGELKLKFRELLLNRCQRDFCARDELVVNDNEMFRGYIQFTGELYVHLEILGEGTEQRIEVLQISLYNLLRTLLDHPTDDNLKCVGQILKFTGAILEDSGPTEGKSEEMNKLMKKISEVTSSASISRYIKEMLLKVIELRNSNWGRTVTSSAPIEEIIQYDSSTTFGDPVFYGPDGQPISVEETQFLESNQYLDEEFEDYGGYGNSDEMWSPDDDMDDEMAAAYEEFLAEQGI